MNTVVADAQAGVLTVADIGIESLRELLRGYRLACEPVPDGSEIAGSFWGEREAGLIGARLLVRGDTPLHSALHEACHYVCMTPDRRAGLHTDAGGDYAEENAVCYLQILLAERLPGVGGERLMRDMDAWGYSFRLGSAQAWFENDAEDARRWLLEQRLIGETDIPVCRLRGS